MLDRIQQMTDQQIEAEFDLYCTARNAEYEAFVGSLTPEESKEFFGRLEAIIAKNKPHGIKKFLHIAGLVATLRFADAAEYAQNGDTEK